MVSGSQWDIGDVKPGATRHIEVDILVPDTLKSETLRVPMEITYFNAHGEQTVTTRMVGFLCQWPYRHLCKQHQGKRDFR